MIEPVLVTQAELARHRNVSRQAVSKWVEAGKITFDENGLIDAAAVDLAFGESVERDEPRDEAESAGSKLTRIRGRLAELELAKKLGEVVPVSGVADAAAACGEVAVRAVRGLSSRVDGFLGNAKDAPTMRAYVKTVERELLTQISEAFAKMAVEAMRKDASVTVEAGDTPVRGEAASLFDTAD